MFTENVLTWLSLILAIRFSVNRLLYFWQWTSFRLDYKKQTQMLMSKSHLFLYFLLCHFFKSSLKLLNLVISRAIFSGCELAAGQARKEIIISNFNLVVRRLQIRAFSLCLLFACRCHLVGKVIIGEQPIFRSMNGSNQWFSAGCCQIIVRRCVEISDLIFFTVIGHVVATDCSYVSRKMFLDDHELAIYIAAGLAGFLIVLWCLAILCKGPCRSFDEPVKSPFEMYMDPATRNQALQTKYELYHYHLMVSRIYQALVLLKRTELRSSENWHVTVFTK